jgi:TolB-like protein/tRNA A-37 threonylcarbamoyl transferase component Bud32
MRLSTRQLARMSRLLDEVIDVDEVGRRQWLQALPPEHRDLEPALRQALCPEEGPADDGDVAAMLPNLRAGVGAAVASRWRPGASVGPYRLVRLLGAGGMAEVWLAQRADGAFKREVALKMPAQLERREDLARRFVIERDILAALEHPHIARFYDAGISEDGTPYLALEHVAGTNLLQWADDHRLDVRARIELFLQVLEAVRYAHDKGVLHRDIKPGNVLVTEAGQVMLLDFGIARFMERPAAADDVTKVYGRALTPAYASPEQLKGERIAAASDVYSLGVVLDELLSRRGRIGKRDLDAIVSKALARSPAQRYASAAALARDLRRYLAGEAVQAVPHSLSYKAGKFLVRNRAGVVLAMAAVVIAAMAYEALNRQLTLQIPAARLATAPPAAPASPDNKSIAVLPFVDMSEKHDQEYFSDGLSEELIDRLTHNPNLRVIARTSAFAFKGTREDIRSIAAKLGVAYLLQGSVRKSGPMLRITAQLVRASDASQLWSQTYDRDVAELFKVQDEIAGTVARALEAAFVDRKAHPGIKEPDIEAYNLVLQGDVYANGPFERDAERAETSFKKASALDPGYALPWVKLGLLYMKHASLSPTTRDEGHALARRAIDTALRIDPTSMAAHAARFRYAVRVDHRWGDARAELDHMRAIDPGDALLLPDCEAYFASVIGKLDEAIRIQRQIVDRDPLNSVAIGTLATYLLESDRFEESLALFQQELELNPHAIGDHGLIGVNLSLLGKGEQALAEIAKERHEGYRLWALSLAHWTSGRHDESDAALLELKNSPQANAYGIAQLYAVRGKRSSAFEWLNKACVERQGGCEIVRIDRFLRNLRDDPRYRALLVKMKLYGDPPPSTP